ncbi:MAG: UDP-N-acetylglucosamine 2-epimerase (non-hydrolyzing) [Sedimentisphaerales bacterium]|nr:UDP-N-acetylglucosamine 2-epimerase (non-hydrolyzing) [Sedimentisphaerales bacterium]
MKLINICGTRPNFIKIAALMAAYEHYSAIEPLLVHTGQHYDQRMSDLFFRELGIPQPDVNLGVGSGTHAAQTAEIMKQFESYVLENRPDAVLVVGDVNSTIACGLVAAKLGIRLIHVEAGLRSFDRTMPEEINRLLTDAISDMLFCSEPSGVDNLLREGKSAESIFLVGNVMIDTLLRNRDKAEDSPILETLRLDGGDYAVLTLHRPANVDDPDVLAGILAAIGEIQRHMPICFAVHPRTRKLLAQNTKGPRLEEMAHVRLTDPLGYLDFLKLIAHARVVLTDSGGIQEETTILQVPCLTLRENTERPVTIQSGYNELVGMDPDRILSGWKRATNGSAPTGSRPELWDGRAGDRIAKILSDNV